MDKETLTRKWLEDQLTEQELEQFRKTEDYAVNMEVLKYAKMFKAPEFSAAESMDTLLENRGQPVAKVRKLWLNRWWRVAAVLLAGFVVYYFYTSIGIVHVNTGIGKKTTIELPDASKVTLNANSEVHYNKSSWENEKRVILSGEAYFEVVEGGKFNVVTPEWIVSVIGTKFNVKQRPQYFEVQCFEGVVRVKSQQFEKDLKAGDLLQDLNGKISVGANVYQQPQWNSNISVFQNAPLGEVLAELERQYEVTVEAEKINENRLFTGGFVHDDLENALTAITQPLNLKYVIDSKQVTVTPR